MYDGPTAAQAATIPLDEDGAVPAPEASALMYCGVCRELFEVLLPPDGVVRCPTCHARPGEF